jgi:DNA-binding transcriptional regulator YiaG
MYRYRESGLRNIWLKNGYRAVATPYAKGIAIAEVAGLHRVIAKHLVEHKPALTGVEFRFLRMELGLSQGKLAEVLDITEQSVSLWERKGREPKWAVLSCTEY